MEVGLLYVDGKLTHIDYSIPLETDDLVAVVAELYLVFFLAVRELLGVGHAEKLLEDLIRADLWDLKQSVDEIFEENHPFFEMLVVEGSHSRLLGNRRDLNDEKGTGRPGYMAVSFACSH